MTIFGPITVQRAAYLAPGQANLCPMDAELNLPENLFSHGVRKLVAREARRVARLARRLGQFWSRPEMEGKQPEDWRSGVDEALGSRGWQPTLDIIRHGLETDPSPELFEEMQFRFAVVHFRPWLEGIDYESFLASREGF